MGGGTVDDTVNPSGYNGPRRSKVGGGKGDAIVIPVRRGYLVGGRANRLGKFLRHVQDGASQVRHVCLALSLQHGASFDQL